MPATEAQILRHAAHLIDTEGWFQKTQKPGTSTFCAYTAINHAALDLLPTSGILDHINRAEEAMRAITHKRRRHCPGVLDNSIMKWNDEPGRTQQEVTTALRKAADLEEQN